MAHASKECATGRRRGARGRAGARHAHAYVARRVGAVDEVEVERRVQCRHCGAQPAVQRLARAGLGLGARGWGLGARARGQGSGLGSAQVSSSAAAPVVR